MMRLNRLLRASLGISLAAAFIATPSAALAGPEDSAAVIPNALEHRYDELRAKLTPSAVKKVSAIAKKVAPKIMTGPGELYGASTAAIPGAFVGALADGDIMALAFIVMMEAAKSAREDLKAIMDGVKAINSQKARLRELAQQVNKRLAELGGKPAPAPKQTKPPVTITSSALRVEYCLAPDVPVPGALDGLTLADLQRLSTDLRQRIATSEQADKCTLAQRERVTDKLAQTVARLKKLLAKLPRNPAISELE